MTEQQVISVALKQTEIGLIPSDWQIKRLKEISPSQSVGLVINPSSYYSPKGTVPMLVGSHVNENKIDWTNANLITSESNQRLPASRLNTGDLVTVRVGEPGVTAVIPEELDQANCASMMIVRKSEKFDSRWLCFLMNSRIGKSQVEGVQYGTAQKQFNIIDAVDFVFPFPTKKEQIAIANALSDVDALIQELEKLIAKKQAIKTATMQQLLTGRTRLPQFAYRADGSKKGYKQSELGEIPEDWGVVKLGELLSYEQPTNYLVKHSKFLDEGLFPVLTAGKSFVLGYTNEENGVLNDLPVVIFDDFTTDSKYVDFPFKVKSSAMKMLKAKSKDTPLYLIFSLLSSVKFLVGDHKRHWIGEFQHICVVISPILKEQNAICELLLELGNEIQALEQRLNKTRQIKQGMMQELLTGRTRLVKPEQA